MSEAPDQDTPALRVEWAENYHGFDLHHFCGAGDLRTWLNQPFSVLDGTGFCNGHTGVLVLRKSEGLPLPDAPSIGTLFKQALMAPAERGNWVPASTILRTDEKCIGCDGSGRRRSRECDDCDGEGAFTHGRHEYDCIECDGTGLVALAGGLGDPICGLCRGTGDRHDRPSSIAAPWKDATADSQHDTLSVQSVYAALLAQLPDCKVLAEPTATGMFLAHFEGGVAVVMGLCCKAAEVPSAAQGDAHVLP